MRIVIEPGLCKGCAHCARLCPKAFGIDAGSRAFARSESVPEGLDEACVDAAEQCPGVAIRFEP